MARAEVDPEGAEGRERVEELLLRGLAVVGEGDVEAVASGGGEDVLAQVATATHHEHPLPLRHPPRRSDLERGRREAVAPVREKGYVDPTSQRLWRHIRALK